ncbi:MAG: hypothetical protein KAY24_00010 [Candidatus Eisenbacteria sp.]|nr:hypothetical protein [Candidatus Eisenbacteria bacterium]
MRVVYGNGAYCDVSWNPEGLEGGHAEDVIWLRIKPEKEPEISLYMTVIEAADMASLLADSVGDSLAGSVGERRDYVV